MIKKLCVLMIVIAVLLAGCGGTASPSSNAAPSSSVTTSSTPAPSTPPSSSSEPSSQPDAPSSNVSAFADMLGGWDEDVYTNEYLGFSFTAEDNWYGATQEELANIMGLSTEMLSGSGGIFNQSPEALQAMLELQTIYDMMAQDIITGSNVIVGYENLAVVVGGSKINEQDYLKAVEAQLSQVEMMGYDNFESSGDETIKIGAFDYYGMAVEATAAEVMQYYLVSKQGSYMCMIIVTVSSDDDFEDIMEMFS